MLQLFSSSYFVDGEMHNVLDQLTSMGRDDPDRPEMKGITVQSVPSSIIMDGRGLDGDDQSIISDRESDAASPPCPNYIPDHIFRKPRSVGGPMGHGVTESSSWTPSPGVAQDEVAAVGIIFNAEVSWGYCMRSVNTHWMPLSF